MIRAVTLPDTALILADVGRPAGAGELAVDLAVSGATVKPAATGAHLLLENSGRKIAYSRLRVTDATGKELSARMEVADKSEIKDEKSEMCLAVLVNDTDAIYPVRIDPTFSDDNWISMGGIPGADAYVRAVAVDGSGNVYVGGDFTVIGDVIANYIAKWDGSRWSALGLGMDSWVSALAVSGNDLYAGGIFTKATNGDGVAVTINRIAKWNGNSWTALGSGVGDAVTSLAVSGSDLYAGGFFTTAGGSPANHIARWNGNSWSALGSGVNGSVYALAASGSDVYAGGRFDRAGGSLAYHIAKWNGSNWSALGSGMNSWCWLPSLMMKLLKRNPNIPYPIGLERDGEVLLKPFSPPYYNSMADAVRAVVEIKYGANGIFRSAGHGSAWAKHDSVVSEVPRVSEAAVEATIAYCEYLWQRYGRFPVYMPPYRTVLGFQACHLDVEFYEKFYRPGW